MLDILMRHKINIDINSRHFQNIDIDVVVILKNIDIDIDLVTFSGE